MAERQPLPESAADLPPLGLEFTNAVAEHASALGVGLDARRLAAIEAHARLLLAWSRHINLTAIRDPGAVARLHVADSLSAVPVLSDQAGPSARILDLGSGGGYPGLVLAAVLPFGMVALVDSVAKKVRFLEVAARAVMEALGQGTPRIDAVHGRAEALARNSRDRGAWDIVVVRAVGSLADVAELGLPLLRPGGRLVAWKRDDPEAAKALSQEIEGAGSIVRAVGGALEAVTLAAPDLLPGNVLVRIRKVHPTPSRYPREPARRRATITRPESTEPG